MLPCYSKTFEPPRVELCRHALGGCSNGRKYAGTRLISIESQPKKVVVVVVVVIIVGYKNLTLKFGQNLVNSK